MAIAIRRRNGSDLRNTAKVIMTDIADKDDVQEAFSGRLVPGWDGATTPDPRPIAGRYCRLEPLSMVHAPDLYLAYQADGGTANWDYLPYGPFDNLDGFMAFLEASCLGRDPLFYAIYDLASERAVGMASYLRIDPPQGVIEVGHIHFSPELQRKPAATETMFLMMQQVFDGWGYRRYEWKCNNLNNGSKQAAERLGFSFEGVFRQAAVVKGRNRDTAWFSVLDSEWPVIRMAFERWLDPVNFDEAEHQRASLASIRAALPVAP